MNSILFFLGRRVFALFIALTLLWLLSFGVALNVVWLHANADHTPDFSDIRVVHGHFECTRAVSDTSQIRYRPWPRFEVTRAGEDKLEAYTLAEKLGFNRKRWRRDVGDWGPAYVNYATVGFPMWLPVLVVMPPAMFWLRKRNARKKHAARASRGLCPACGYDLRASVGRCPECGLDVPAPAEPDVLRRAA